MTTPYKPGDYVTITHPLSGWIERPARVVAVHTASVEVTIGRGYNYVLSWCYVTGSCSRAAYEHERTAAVSR